MTELLQNRILILPIMAWVICQILKVVIAFGVERKLDLNYLTTAGGMPSAHSAIVAALATAIAQELGFGSPLFAMAVVFAFIVMYDATGVRQTVGTHARILNRLLEAILVEHQINEARLRELVGHTPLQVLVGAVLGISLALLWIW